MKKITSCCVAVGALLALPATSYSALVSVSGPNSSKDVAPAIIAAPDSIADDSPGAENRAMQGFNERQGVFLVAPIGIDGATHNSTVQLSGNLRVDSHMIFLNSAPNANGGNVDIRHGNVIWEFDGPILGVMSNRSGGLEVASSSFLGSLTTTYPNATFDARGLEALGDGSTDSDGYAIIEPNKLRVGMHVTEPGDWIRVITRSNVPSGGNTIAMFGAALLGLGAIARKKRRA